MSAMAARDKDAAAGAAMHSCQNAVLSAVYTPGGQLSLL